MYLNSIVNFRALAIFLIVTGHTFGVAQLDMDNGGGIFVTNLILGATSFFVFISGYMLNHVFARKYSFRSFIIPKFRNIMVPYLVLSLLLISLNFAADPNFVDIFVSTTPTELWLKIIQPTAMSLAVGEVMGPYWYIPFIMLMFLAAPLHMRFIELNLPAKLAIFALACILALFAQRPAPNLNPFHSFVFFTPAYLLGILCSYYRDEFLAFMRGKELYVLGVALTIDLVQVITGHAGNYHKVGFFSYAGIDLMLAQKLVLSLALFALLERWESIRLKPVSLVSKTSFAIFFLHPIILNVLNRINTLPLLGIPWLDLFLLSTAVCAACIACALILRSILGARSRYIIGY